MGTIGHQPPRKDFVYEDSNVKALEADLKDMTSLANRHGVALQDVIALRAAISRESMVRTMREDGDYRDEHAGGIGDALRSIAYALEGKL